MNEQDTIPVVEVTETSPRSETAPRVDELTGGGVSWRSALTAAGTWILAIFVVDAMAPAPDPDAVMSALEMVLTLGYTAALMVGVFGLALRQRIGLQASVAAGGLFVAGSVSCWAGGHVGSWIAVQAMFGVAMMLLGTGLLRRS